METLGALIIQRKPPYPLRPLRKFHLVADGNSAGELSMFRTHVMLPTGIHRLSLTWPGGNADSNEVEVEVSPQQILALEFREAWKVAGPVTIRVRKAPSGFRKLAAAFLKKLSLLVFLTVAGLGIWSLGAYAIHTAWHYVVLKTDASHAAAIEFWEGVLWEGTARETITYLSPELDVDWASVVNQVISSTGNDPNIMLAGLGGGLSQKRVDLQISGSDGSVQITTFLTKPTGDSRWIVSGFDVFHGRLDLESHSSHLPAHPRPEVLLTLRFPIQGRIP